MIPVAAIIRLVDNLVRPVLGDGDKDRLSFGLLHDAQFYASSLDPQDLATLTRLWSGEAVEDPRPFGLPTLGEPTKVAVPGERGGGGGGRVLMCTMPGQHCIDPACPVHKTWR